MFDLPCQYCDSPAGECPCGSADQRTVSIGTFPITPVCGRPSDTSGDPCRNPVSKSGDTCVFCYEFEQLCKQHDEGIDRDEREQQEDRAMRNVWAAGVRVFLDLWEHGENGFFRIKRDVTKTETSTFKRAFFRSLMLYMEEPKARDGLRRALTKWNKVDGIE